MKYLVVPKISPFSFGDGPTSRGQYITVQCTVTEGDLPLNIYWRINGKPIINSLDVEVSKMGKRSSVLTIESVNGHHAGNYSCEADNFGGSTSFSTELKVIG